MENYVLAPKAKGKPSEVLADNEIRVVASNHMRTYVSHGISLLTEKGHDTIVLKAMGRAINKTVGVVEVLKRRVPGLHQVTEVASADIMDIWEPTPEGVKDGLEKVEVVRHVSVITVTLSTKPLDSSALGYQAPLPEDQVTPGPADESTPDALIADLEARASDRPDRSDAKGGRGDGEGAREATGGGARRGGGARGRRARGRGRSGDAAAPASGAGDADGTGAGAGAGAGTGAAEAQGGAPARSRHRGARRGRGRGGRGGRSAQAPGEPNGGDQPTEPAAAAAAGAQQ